MAQYIPIITLFLCDIIYILEDRLADFNRKWIFNVAAVILHIFIIIYFLLTESPMEIVLLFLTASFAAAITIHSPKSNKTEKSETAETAKQDK